MLGVPLTSSSLRSSERACAACEITASLRVPSACVVNPVGSQTAKPFTWLSRIFCEDSLVSEFI